MPTLVEIPVSGGPLPATWVAASGPPAAALLLVPSIFGTDAGTVQAAEVIAAAGHPVLIPTLFHRQDPGPAAFDEAGRERAYARMRAYDRPTGLADLGAAVSWLRARPECSGSVVAHGICFGGHLSALLGLHGTVDGVHTVHGSGIDKVAAQGPLGVPLTFHTGSLDGSIPPAAVEAIRAAWPHAEIHVHEGAQHGFAHPGSPVFDPAVYQASIATLLAMLGSAPAA